MRGVETQVFKEHHPWPGMARPEVQHVSHTPAEQPRLPSPAIPHQEIIKLNAFQGMQPWLETAELAHRSAQAPLATACPLHHSQLSCPPGRLASNTVYRLYMTLSHTHTRATATDLRQSNSSSVTAQCVRTSPRSSSALKVGMRKMAPSCSISVASAPHPNHRLKKGLSRRPERGAIFTENNSCQLANMAPSRVLSVGRHSAGKAASKQSASLTASQQNQIGIKSSGNTTSEAAKHRKQLETIGIHTDFNEAVGCGVAPARGLKAEPHLLVS